MRVIAIDKDTRSECTSVLTDMLLEEYKDLAFDSFNANGNFEGQRGVITKSAAAARIRKRMQDDFCRGTIFPQVVLGIQTEKTHIEKLQEGKEYNSLEIFSGCTVSIIDGMQRSNIYFKNFSGNEKRKIRVEFWVADNSEKLLYRMLVLNTGQTPWNTRRQIEVIYGNLSKNIENELYKIYPELKDKIDIYAIDDGKRRTQAGKYHKSAIIELYLGFNIRNVKINVSDELAEEYQRFDVMESIEKEGSFSIFICILGMMCKLDLAFSEYGKKCEEQGQFTEGKDIFASSTACVGFVVASAEYILGKISVDRSKEKIVEKCDDYKKQMFSILKALENNKAINEDYLSLEILNAKCAGLPKTRIGDEMRIMFKDAFMSMLKYVDIAEILSLGDFWRE
ncbi:MAG: hypothetical protein J6C19_09240 [Lachnospiraceae bacterium]|nr:hypothetical protein [Lachnospiraceae bacterium]